MHRPVPKDVSFPSVEEEVLAFWRAEDVPGRTLRHREGANEFVFYEGPPTANAPPGTHHMMARFFKDIYTRFATMRGLYVPRKAGWDCHGLPVEIQVERKLGFTRKQQVIDHGIERFNQLCRESVQEYVAEWERFSQRLGFWLDYENAYRTMDNHYIESVWWSLTQLHKRGLLYEDDKVVPYCPRCETPLSDHELGQPDVYRHVSDPSLYAAFAVTGDGPLAGAELAIWTTTPWTLLSHLAVAVHPEIAYALVEHDGRRLVVAADLVGEALGEGATVLDTFPGSTLLGTRYEPPFPFAGEAMPELADTAWRVLDGSAFVTTDEGTGLVHMTAAFGAEDLETCRRAGIPTFNPVDRSGRFTGLIPPYAGRFVKEADPDIISDLRERGRLLRAGDHVHPYPHCWRCDSPLLYYALTSWYVRTTQMRERLLEVNSKVNWVPEHIRDGRYGRWLENNVDWSLSRYRFWGTPLPIWRCPQGHATPVESAADLGRRSGQDLSGLDLHRPFVDEVVFDCPDCGEQARRIPDVIDVWYDSGAMPYAQHGYPHHDLETFRRRFPADFIAEAVDQTRGWFYTLMAEGVLLFDDTAFRNVVCHGHLVDGEGRKMSKSLGNVIDPWELLERYGSDVCRFYFMTAGPPGESRRISHEMLDQVARRPFLTLWNVYRLFVTYANIDGFDPKEWPLVEPQLRPDLDRWILSELHQTIEEVSEGLESFDALRAGRRIVEFVDDLSNWYVRRSRRRFWREARTDAEGADKNAAYWTLWTCLSELARVLAPFAPFIAEAMYRNLVVGVNPQAPDSVHLTDFPRAESRLIDPALAETMAVARTLVSLGHSARSDAQVKVRQPLSEAVLLVPAEYRADAERAADLIAEELNVRRISFAEDVGTLVHVSLRPNYRVAGPELGPRVGMLAKALVDPQVHNVAAEVADTLEAGQAVDIDLDDGTVVRVTIDHVDIRREPAEGTAFAYQAPYGVSLNLELDDELRAEGIARELVHQLQNLRKAQGREVTDRVSLALAGPDEVMRAVRAHEAYVAEEVLATELTLDASLADGADTIAVEGHEVRVELR
ncbi:MAG TPA: isoleucine--tRNA ligase [Actinomycetota bacterium]|nr:isoleucine--tRNA ligase [Actinomycetota bacterium]